MSEDWRYNEEKISLRKQVLKVLLAKYGGQMEGVLPKYTTQSMYECAHDWVSQGNVSTAGIVSYYEAYYS
jgi:polyhydroxyalkanoate synthesis regulator protein